MDEFDEYESPEYAEYLRLIARLRENLPADLVHDVETYRRHCERTAYRIGLIDAQQLILKRKADDDWADDTPWNPFRKEWDADLSPLDNQMGRTSLDSYTNPLDTKL